MKIDFQHPFFVAREALEWVTEEQITETRTDRDSFFIQSTDIQNWIANNRLTNPKLVSYFNQLGITEKHVMELIILSTIARIIRNEPLNESEIFMKAKKVQQRIISQRGKKLKMVKTAEEAIKFLTRNKPTQRIPILF